jgi:serine/threonine protein kinase/WD40 repeat protein
MTAHELVRDLTQHSASERLSRQQSEKLEQILADYLERLEHGETPDTGAIVADFPELADELRENFAKLGALHRAAVGMTDGGETLDQLCATNLVEQRILGDFRLVRPIGRGGMGVVYEAEQISLNRRVALKTLPLAAVLDPKQLARFKNEAQAASLDHPHIVSVYAVGSDRGVHYYAMQFIEGLSLAEVIEQLRRKQDVGCSMLDVGSNRPSSIQHPTSSIDTQPMAALSTLKTARPTEYFRSVARLGIQAAQALHYAHEMGVVHRDVKPSNLLLDNDGQLYVTDFGLAMTPSDSNLTMTGDLLGTLRYMSPEQACGRRALVDRRTDIYSLGASLYELATLRPAFPEEDRARLLQQIVTDPAQRPSQLNREIPKDLETVILKAMAKEPSSRYETAHELADDLGRFIKREPIRARRISKLEYARSWCRRNKMVATLLGAVTALLLVLAIGGPLAAVKQARLARQAQEELNAKNINQLYQDWFSGNVERVKEELKRHYATVDGDEYLFEWELLRQMYDDSRKTILFENARGNAKGETGFLKIVEFSPDGRWLACGQNGDQISIYDMEHKTFRQLDNEPAGDAPADVAFTPDSRQLITVSWTGVINCRDVATSRVVDPIIECGIENERVSWQNRFRLCPDGKTAVVGFESGVLALARLATGTCTRIPAHNAEVLAIAFSPDGSTLVSSGPDQSVKFWDLNTNELLRAIETRSYITDIQFSPDGRRLAVSDSLRGFCVLDASSLTELGGLRSEPQHVSKLAMYRDEILATAGGDDRIVLWDMESGNRLDTLVGHEGDVRDMAFSHDGMSLASSAADGTLRLWPVGQIVREAKERIASSQSWKTDLQFAADGNKLVACSRPHLAPVGASSATVMKEWSQATGLSETIVEEGTHGRCDLAIVPGIDHLLCAGPGGLAVKDRLSGDLIRRLDGDPTHEYQHVAVSPDGKWAAGCGHILTRPRQSEYFALKPSGNPCFVAIVDLKSNKRDFFPLLADTDTWIINSIVFSPDGKFLVTGGGDGYHLQRVDIFERMGDAFRHLHPREVTGGSAVQDVGFSADSRLLGTAAIIGYGHIRSLRGLPWEATIYRKNGLNALAFSPDGRILALGGSSGIQLCHLQSQFPLATIPIGRVICDLQFSPDGRTLAWSADDGRVEFLRTTPTESVTSMSAASVSQYD